MQQPHALKVLIANYLGRQEQTSLCVDIDCMSLAKAEIFCKRTMFQLRSSGIVMAARKQSYENGFVITYSEHPQILKVCQEMFDQAFVELDKRPGEEGNYSGGDFYVEYYSLLSGALTLPPGCRTLIPVKPVPLPVSQFD